MQRKYTIEVYADGGWREAYSGIMSKQCAEGMLSQFAQQYRARLVNQYGKVIVHRGVVRGAEGGAPCN